MTFNRLSTLVIRNFEGDQIFSILITFKRNNICDFSIETNICENLVLNKGREPSKPILVLLGAAQKQEGMFPRQTTQVKHPGQAFQGFPDCWAPWSGAARFVAGVYQLLGSAVGMQLLCACLELCSALGAVALPQAEPAHHCL